MRDSGERNRPERTQYHGHPTARSRGREWGICGSRYRRSRRFRLSPRAAVIHRWRTRLPGFPQIRGTSRARLNPPVRPHQRLNQHRTSHRQMTPGQRGSLEKLCHPLNQRREGGQRIQWLAPCKCFILISDNVATHTKLNKWLGACEREEAYCCSPKRTNSVRTVLAERTK